MPTYDKENICGMVENWGKVKCSDCMEDADYDLAEERENFIYKSDLDGEKVYICDYCNKRL